MTDDAVTDQEDVVRRPARGRRPVRRPGVWAVVGGVLGLAVGAGVYLLLEPLVEGSGTALEELGGLLWNIVPGGGVLGALVGVWLAGRRTGTDESTPREHGTRHDGPAPR